VAASEFKHADPRSGPDSKQLPPSVSKQLLAAVGRLKGKAVVVEGGGAAAAAAAATDGKDGGDKGRGGGGGLGIVLILNPLTRAAQRISQVSYSVNQG
jgi:hypothetical protein